MVHQGAIHIASGDVKNGAKLLREALDRNPGFDTSTAALAAQLLETTRRPRS
jgi:hypothetical protein